MINALIHSLKNQLAQQEATIQQQQAHYISLQLPLKKSILLAPVDFCDSFFLSQPDSGFTLLGLNSFLTFKAQGEQRITNIRNDFSKAVEKWCKTTNDRNNLPIAFLVFAFNESDPMTGHWQSLPNTLLTIPRILIKEVNSSQTLIVNIKLEETSANSAFSQIKSLLQQLYSQTQTDTHNSAPSAATPTFTSVEDKGSRAYEKWLSLTNKAIKQIQSGQFDKLVTSRQHSLQTTAEIATTDLVQKLIHYYPCCSILAYHINNKTIVAASPERLLALQHPDIQSKAIGGTISRNKQFNNKAADSNANPLPFFLKQATEKSHEELAESKKLLKEHHFISQNIYQNLDPLCHTLKMPITPFLMKLHNLYHLETPIQGNLMDHYNVFDCIEALHPTPAVAGIPTQQAKQWLSEHEDYHRGWYTGAFGWIDAEMNADLSVMLRCALLEKHEHRQQINLFSGAGLIAESEPDAEWQETELKMHTIIEML